MNLSKLFQRLYSFYGPQGWWPVLSLSGRDGRDDHGYLLSVYQAPIEEVKFEISVGAVLTQNTSWKNAERAVRNLVQKELCSPKHLLTYPIAELSELIYPAGYHNMKALKLRSLAEFFLTLINETDGLYRYPDRNKLLSVWGIGPETADSILLYAFAQPTFVIDAYTRRILHRLGITEENVPYERLQELISNSIPNEISIYNEYHALFVCHAKRFCLKVPKCNECPLLNNCRQGQGIKKEIKD